MKSIYEIAADAGIREEHLEPYGKYKAKIDPALLEELQGRPDGRLVLVTAVNPTPAGEGKTLTTIGLAQSLNAIGRRTVAALREPSLGPVFGMKGGATGGGRAQIVPEEEINLHFTGDLHAITSANNLLSAMIDNHIYQGNALQLDPARIVWKRALDMNDRGLRSIVTGLGPGNGPVRESGFLITSASEVMAVLCLSENLEDLKRRLGQILIGYDVKGLPVTADKLKAVEAMAVLLKEAIKPNLVQTLEGTPVLVHGGPFANIAHGCSSLIATRTALKLGDIVVTEAGFGAELGAEKFFDIKCRQSGLKPSAAVLVVTAKALKYNGGAAKDRLGTEDLDSLKRGMGNLRRHVRNLQKFGVPVLVAINHFATDTDAEMEAIREECAALGVPAEVSKVFALGSEGGKQLAYALAGLLEEGQADFRPLYDTSLDLKSKIETIVKDIYGGEAVTYSPSASRALAQMEKLGYGGLPVCMAKTPYSFTDQPALLGAPEGFTVSVSGVSLSAGAGFIVVETGNTMRMPGLPKVPAAERMALGGDGQIEGLL
ncbi:formate--tetrahydrofolate ligase [Paenibacillus yonginensis]|uniref:Formate--tetrahydrofolate ligase n=1 Tax=Paenibacillus yonginensis TaxID=1462996 RepID=A0A1B1N6K7_9BACL|nr:formate--tetrahydrofolate ligase [Paenibacillus yonginensis]ANS77054.1 formate--tetrahydrofolate ligase [Paenibacillus yonginensis]